MQAEATQERGQGEAEDAGKTGVRGRPGQQSASGGAHAGTPAGGGLLLPASPRLGRGGGGRRAPGSILGGQGSAGVVAGEGGRKGDMGSGHTVSAQTPGEPRQGPGCQPYRWLVMAPTVQSPVCPLLLRRPGWEGTVGHPSTCPYPACPNDTHSLLERVPWSPRILKNKMLGFVVSMTTSTQHGIQ